MKTQNCSDSVALLEPPELGMDEKLKAVTGIVQAEMTLRYGDKSYSPRTMAIYLLRLVFLGNVGPAVDLFSEFEEDEEEAILSGLMEIDLKAYGFRGDERDIFLSGLKKHNSDVTAQGSEPVQVKTPAA